MTSGEIVAHLGEGYGMSASKEMISTITDSDSDTRVPGGRDSITD